MYEFIRASEDTDADSWADICAEVEACEWRLLQCCKNAKQAIESRGPIEIISFCGDYTSEYYDVDEAWQWKDTCQCQSREYHFYVHCDRYYGEPLETVIIRHVGPDLHVDLNMTEHDGRTAGVEFTYKLSGNLICELEADTVARLLPSAFDVECFLRSRIGGLTDQQSVFLHTSPAFEEFLSRRQNQNPSGA